VPDLPKELEVIDFAELFANPDVQISESLVRGIKLQSPLFKTFRVASSLLQGLALPNAILQTVISLE
jgi:hypothetical protein